MADIVVAAAGASRRMDGIDKLTATIGGRPLLAWTVGALTAATGIGRVVVVVASDRVHDVASADWLRDSTVPVTVVGGGGRRQESVAAGVAALDAPDDRVILVHDGARPSVRPELVDAVIEAVRVHGAAIPVLPVAETTKRIGDGLVLETVDRSDLATAQTPQGARAGLLRRAWAEFPPDGPATFTDEAALLEAARIAVHAIPGDPMNLKVTVPDDLVRAAGALGVGAAGTTTASVGLGRDGVRVGSGRDSHPFGPGSPLALGGIVIDGGPRLHGHSDGDVALHAVADALLGATGLGDLGRLFPPASTPGGIASRELLTDVVGRVRAAGYEASSIDLTIVGARPRLSGRLDGMRDAIAAILALDPARVDVKASSGNLAGMEGAGRGISAHAVAVVVPLASAPRSAER